MSNSLQPHESQHSRPPCPSPTPGVHSNVHRVSDAIQPFHPLSSPSPPAFNPSQHQATIISPIFCMGLYSFSLSKPAIVNTTDQVSYATETSFLLVLVATSPRSPCQQDFLLRLLSLACRCYLLPGYSCCLLPLCVSLS